MGNECSDRYFQGVHTNSRRPAAAFLVGLGILLVLAAVLLFWLNLDELGLISIASALLTIVLRGARGLVLVMGKKGQLHYRAARVGIPRAGG